MELRQLRYFVHVVEAGSVRAAASRVHVAQSALSRHVLALERELGVRLFERHARGINLTPSGSLLRGRTRDILQDIEQLKNEVMARASLPGGEAVIGTTSTTSRILYGPLAERFARDYPNVKLRFIEGVPYLLLEGLDTGNIDLAVMVDPEPRASLVLEPLVTEQEYVIGARGSIAMPDGPCEVAALSQMPQPSW